jgi:glutathionylspermidine synthase
MHCVTRPIKFDLNTILIEELPWTQAFYREGSLADGVFKQDVTDYFAYPLAHQADMPFYVLKQSSCADLETTFERAYHQLVEAVGRLFKEPHHVLMRYMDCEFLRKHPYFIDYAKWSYNNRGSNQQALYGRFDAAFDPVTETVTGIYEFNGDTPTMLFESVNLQNRLCEQFTGDTEQQLNSFYPLVVEMLAKQGEIPGHAAVLFNADSFEDMATAETLAQAFGENNKCIFTSFNEIDYDHSCREKPFVIGDTRLDVIFALSPWEEMVDNFSQGYKEWANWATSVTFLEPAWRWFTSNKGIWAYITHLRESDPMYADSWDDVPTLATYRSDDNPFHGKQAYVSKPVLGRMSSNVTIYNSNGNVEGATEGPYPMDNIVQEYHAPGRIEGRDNFIIGMFMVPDPVVLHRDMPQATAGTLCIREFDSNVLNVENERFIPHILV